MNLLRWLVALIAVGGLTAGAAWLAFDASPLPIIIDNPAPIVQEEQWDVHVLYALYDGFMVRVDPGTEPNPEGLLYLVELWYSSATDCGFVRYDFYLEMPDGEFTGPTIDLPTEKFKIEVRRIWKVDESKEDGF